MSLPLNYDTVPVRGKYVYLDGTTASGQVKFSGKVAAISDAADTIILPNTIIAPLDADGSFTVNLPATDDPDVLPNGWTYTVTESLTGGSGRTYDIDVPISAKSTGIDLSDVAPRPAATGTSTAFVTLTAFAGHTHEVSGPVAWDSITGKPSTFAPSAHTHPQSDVTGLSTTLAGKADLVHGHAIADTTGLQTALDGKSDAGHTHSGSGGTNVYPLAGYGLVSATDDILTFRGAAGLTDNTIFWARLWIPANTPINGLWVGVRTGGVHDGATGPNHLALYTDAGALVGTTADDPALWSAAGWRGGPLVGGPVAAQGSGRFVYVAALSRGQNTDPIVCYPGNAVDFAPFTAGPAGGNRRCFYTGGSAFPANVNPASTGTATAFVPLYGIS